jgi:alpha-ketoglutarate-dependent taurine dioxygenase
MQNYIITHLEPFGVIVKPKDENINVQDLDIKNLRALFEQKHLILLRGFNTFKYSDEFSNYCEAWGEVSLWPFGKVLELIEQIKPEDHIFDNSYIPLHWDGMYRPQIPEYQIFHCVEAPLAGQGGRTTFSNTVSALKNTPNELKELWNRVTGVYQRKMEFYNSKTVSPIVVKHPFRDFSVIRYNEIHSEKKGRFINPPNIEFLGVSNEELNKFHESLVLALYNPQNFYAHEWEKGDVVIADNFSLLHGREHFTSRSPRHLQRVHILSNPPLDNSFLESYDADS